MSDNSNPVRGTNPLDATITALTISPTTGWGGTLITITGRNFSTAAGQVILQEKTGAWWVQMTTTILSDTVMQGVLPDLPDGIATPALVDVYVWDNTSNASVIYDTFSYIEPIPFWAPQAGYPFAVTQITIGDFDIADATGVWFDEWVGPIVDAESVGDFDTVTADSPILPNDRPSFEVSLETPIGTRPLGTFSILPPVSPQPEPPGPGGVPMHQGRCLALANISDDTAPAGLQISPLGFGLTDILDLMDHDANGIICDTVDLGFPDIREDEGVWPDANGSWDFTRFFGSRGITLSGTLVDSARGSHQRARSALMPYLSPPARPILIYSFTADDPVSYLRLRANGYAGAITNPVITKWSGQWKCPDAVSYAATINSLLIIPSESLGVGRIYTEPQPVPGPPGTITHTSAWRPNRHYPPMVGATSANAHNSGTAPAWPIFKVSGDCTAPAIFNDSTGDCFAMASGYRIYADEVLTIDTQNRLVYLGPSSSASRYQFVDFAQSSWWPLQPGDNSIRFDPVSIAGTKAQLVVAWQDAYI